MRYIKTFSAGLGRFIVATALLVSVLFLSQSLFAQSTDRQYPTPITTNEISGQILPRALGDSRVTSYYWVFDGTQGDIFINAVFENLNGEIEVFVTDGLRSVARIVSFADFGETETGRVFYLRKPERLLLRVQGRTPNDDPATFRIKFAGSYAAISDVEQFRAPELPTISREDRVAAAEPETKEPEEDTTKEPADDREIEAAKTTDPTPKEETVRQEPGRPRLRVVVEDLTPQPVTKTPEREQEKVDPEEPSPAVPDRRNARQRRGRDTSKTRTDTKAEIPDKEAPPTEEPAPVEEVRPEEETSPLDDEKPEEDDHKTPEDKTERPASALQGALVVTFLDGSTLDIPMSDVQSFSVDGKVLRVTAKNGRTRRFQMTEIASITLN